MEWWSDEIWKRIIGTKIAGISNCGCGRMRLIFMFHAVEFSGHGLMTCGVLHRKELLPRIRFIETLPKVIAGVPFANIYSF